MHTMKSKDIPNPEQPKSQSDFWKNKKQYDNLIQQGQQFVITKERESQDVLKKMDL